MNCITLLLSHKKEEESFMNTKESKTVVIIGAGVLSTTFGSMLKEIEPNWNIKLYERLDRPGIESSNERHNAGTGHAALCELNYTVRKPDGSIDIEKQKEINEQFEISKQFWSHLVKIKVFLTLKNLFSLYLILAL